jgi:hypothetical protein
MVAIIREADREPVSELLFDPKRRPFERPEHPLFSKILHAAGAPRALPGTCGEVTIVR